MGDPLQVIGVRGGDWRRLALPDCVRVEPDLQGDRRMERLLDDGHVLRVPQEHLVGVRLETPRGADRQYACEGFSTSAVNIRSEWATRCRCSVYAAVTGAGSRCRIASASSPICRAIVEWSACSTMATFCACRRNISWVCGSKLRAAPIASTRAKGSARAR